MKDNADLRKLTSLLMLNDRNQTEALLAIYGIEARMHPEFTSSFFDVTGTSFLFRTIRDKARLDVLKNHPMLVRLDPDPNDNSIEFRWPTSVLDARRALGMVFPEFLDDKQWAAFVNQWSKLMNAEEPDVFTPEAAPEPAKAEAKKKLTKKKDAPAPAPEPAPEPAKAEPAKPAEKKTKKKEEKPEPPKAEAKGKKPKKAEPEDSFDVDLGGDEPNTQSAEDALLEQAGAAASAGDYEAAVELTTEANAVAGHGPEPDEDEARLPAGNIFDDETAIETASAFAHPASNPVDVQPEPEPEPEPKPEAKPEAKPKSKAPKSPFPDEPRPKWYQRFTNFASYANEELFRMVAMLNECLTASRDGFPKEQLEALKDAMTRLAAKTAQEAFKGQALDEPDMDPMVGLTIINVKNQVQASLRDLELNPASPEQWEKFQKSMSEVKDMGKSAQKIFGQDGAASMIQQPPRLKDERGVPIVS